MHEITVIEKIIRIVLASAGRNRVQKIKKVYLKIGAFNDYEDKWMTRYFREFSKNTAAEEAELIIEKQKALIKCSSCRYETDIELKTLKEFICPQCGKDCRIIGDSDYTIVNMEVI